eukprot:6206336-Pleurochrysis_carterae.AAC.2
MHERIVLFIVAFSEQCPVTNCFSSAASLLHFSSASALASGRIDSHHYASIILMACSMRLGPCFVFKMNRYVRYHAREARGQTHENIDVYVVKLQRAPHPSTGTPVFTGSVLRPFRKSLQSLQYI